MVAESLPLHSQWMQFNNSNKQETAEGICGSENVNGFFTSDAEITIISDGPSP